MCVTEEKAKHAIPKPLWGLPYLFWAGMQLISKSGSPRIGLVVFLIWGLAYALFLSSNCYSKVCVCVNSATDALGLSHDGLSRHRAGLPAHLGAAVNKD